MPAISRALILGVLGLLATEASAYEFRARFSGRTSIPEDPISGNTVQLPPGSSLRIRVQFGLFDDAGAPAPAGGVIGWQGGTIERHGGIATRTPGRLSPFNFSTHPNANGNPPLPGGDPFTLLTEIDATLGTQSPIWGFDGAGQPLPMPQPAVRGINQFVSIFEFTLAIPLDATQNFTVDIGGSAIAATEWRIVGVPTPPDPDTMTPGSVTYAPVMTEPAAFSATLLVIVPGPAASVGAGAALILTGARRRRR